MISHGSGEAARERKLLDRRSRSEAKISGTAETARKRKFLGTVKLLEDESFWERRNHLEATKPLGCESFVWLSKVLKGTFGASLEQ